MLSTFEDSSEKSIHDISKIMEARKNLKQMYVKMLVPCLLVEALEVASFVYGILRRNFIPFAVVMALAIICVAIVFNYWHRNIMYICPQCHTTFKPKKREAFFAGHTTKTRKLTCPECNRKIKTKEPISTILVGAATFAVFSILVFDAARTPKKGWMYPFAILLLGVSACLP
jgi:DNA-directed RNA polymerase subunit RPC12/RpoP